MNMLSERNYALDLLKIISMLMIILLHLGSHGGMNIRYGGGTGFLMTLISCISVCSVNIFVLISGYFMCDKSVNFYRMVRIIGAILFYSWLIGGVLSLSDLVQMDFISILHTLLPVSYSLYWFPTAYLGMCVFIPILNIVIKALSKKQYKISLIVGFLIFSFWGDITPISDPCGINMGYSMLWFMYLYMLSAYVKIYKDELKLLRKNCVWFFFCSVLLLSVIFTISNVLQGVHPFLAQYNIGVFLSEYCSVIVLVESVSLFLIFEKLKIKKSGILQKCIVWISPALFGVLLIHDNANFRSVLYYRILKLDEVPSGIVALGARVGYAIIIFIVCILIEKTRILFFSIWENGKMKVFCNSLQEKFYKNWLD